METEKSDQQQFDEQVNKTGKLVLEVLAGVGIVAALMMSTAALIKSGEKTESSSAPAAVQVAAPAAASLPSSANVMIDHATRGCHVLTVNGGTPTTSATIRLAAGGTLHVMDNDVMPHRLVATAGPAPQFVDAAMNHMGAQSTVTFPTAGTYSLTTKAGEDYTSGITTIGEDNTLHIKVVVASA